MQFVEGRTLAQRIKDRQKLPLNKALEAMRDVARALGHAHGQGVLHRDLKPQNILLDAQDRPHVLDFGLAQLNDSGTKLTATGAMLGTPAYMPPEQANSEKTDERSDVYSLGATLYYVLTARPPFEGSTPLNVMHAVLRKTPEPPSRLNPRAAGDLDTITLRCLEKDPARRYPSASELAEDLERHLAGDPIRARPIGRVERSWRWARRNKAGRRS
jgi:serine/threonine-protein kinase